jgi:hypothetical protein
MLLRTQFSPISVFSLLLGALGILIFFFVINTRPTVTVDSAIDIGNLGVELPTPRRLVSVESWTGSRKDVRIQEAQEILVDLQLKYGFDTGEFPALTHRIPVTQARQGGRVFEMSFEGRDNESVMGFGQAVSGWLTKRHAEYFQEAHQERDRILTVVKKLRKETREACDQPEDSVTHSGTQLESPQKSKCNLEGYSRWAIIELRARLHDVDNPPRVTELILRPTARSL